jgi:hypothetical protein
VLADVQGAMKAKRKAARGAKPKAAQKKSGKKKPRR